MFEAKTINNKLYNDFVPFEVRRLRNLLLH